MTLSIDDIRILRLPEVKRITGLGRTSIYQMMKDGIFPRSISLGSRAIGWKFGDIREWLESRPTT